MATLLGVSKSTVRKMADRGLLLLAHPRRRPPALFRGEPAVAGATPLPHTAHLTRFRIHLLHGKQGHATRLPEHSSGSSPMHGFALASIYSALMELGRTQPHIVIADLDAASERDFAIVHSIRNDESLRKSFVLLLGGSEQGLAAQNQVKGYVSYFPGTTTRRWSRPFASSAWVSRWSESPSRTGVRGALTGLHPAHDNRVSAGEGLDKQTPPKAQTPIIAQAYRTAEIIRRLERSCGVSTPGNSPKGQARQGPKLSGKRTGERRHGSTRHEASAF
jgi:hypothetical protein